MSSVSKSTADRVVSALLGGGILVLVGLIIQREIRSASASAPTPPPVYEQEWRALIRGALVVGDTAAPIQIVEFIDLQCPACRSQHASLNAVRKKFGGQVAFNFVHFPLPSHPYAAAAAAAAECAHRQGASLRFIDAVFAQQDSLGLKTWTSYAAAASVGDSSLFASCLDDDLTRSAVVLGTRLGKDFGVTSTPTMIVNGWRFQGTLPKAELDALVSRLLQGRQPQDVGALLAAPAAGADTSREGGVRRVRYRSSALSEAPQAVVPPIPVATIGNSQASDFDAIGIGAADFLADGRLVAFAAVGARIVVYDRNGRGERRIGTIGSGPREIRRPTGIARGPGDSLVFLDAVLRRRFWASPDAGIVREQPLLDGVPVRVNRAAGVLSTKELVVFDPNGRPLLSRDTERLSALAEVGLVDTLGIYRKLAELSGATYVNVNTLYRGRASQERDIVRLGSTAYAAAWNGYVITASSGLYRIEFRTRTGQLAGILTVDMQRRAVTAAMRAYVVERELGELRNLRGERLIDAAESERLIRKAPYSDSLPLLNGVFVAPNQILWVVDAIAPTDAFWSATGFRIDGRIVARIRSEAPGTPLAFGNDRVALLGAGPDGEMEVRVHQILLRQ